MPVCDPWHSHREWGSGLGVSASNLWFYALGMVVGVVLGPFVWVGAITILEWLYGRKW